MTEFEVESEKHDRIYRVLVDIYTDEEWELEEMWWVNAPFSAMDDHGILCFQKIAHERYYINTDEASYEVDTNTAYAFMEDIEDELQEQISEHYMRQARRFNY